jgi:DNA polymerase/3'-5' exonuclease PolX
MKKLYYKKGGTGEFNCDYLILTLEDLEDLEKDVRENNLPNTEGFFFGNNSPDNESIRNDIDFIYAAKRAIGDGLYVFYSSWW